MSIRKAKFAGSWYSNDPKTLKEQISNLLSKAERKIELPIKALICPHAGYKHSAPTAAQAWKNIDPKTQKIKRVFILGPSHKKHLETCCISCMSAYETPFGTIKVDQKTITELSKYHEFFPLTEKVEQNEHSLELQLPFIVHVLGTEVEIVPMMVGHLSEDEKQRCGEILSSYLKDENTLFVISSDFCHWGSRFHFTTLPDKSIPIWQAIQKLDRMGMNAIESLNPKNFYDYLDKWGTTICGRNPISVLLNAVDSKSQEMKFVHYDQSSKVMTNSDSSVSYAAGCLYEKKN
ncbi:protein memo1 [Anaeramoeba ignava]|uniref:Protein memo1 n=1 Tax=Anaeramoeba ignava TaxID=1746090 RepID=A0A9Q0REL6_ANAIG|nr:protein memo1 [Anaeramoeba ignava]